MTRKHRLFALMLLASALVHVVVIARLSVPPLQLQEADASMLITLSAPPAVQAPEPEPEPEPVDAEAMPLIPALPAPAEFAESAIPDEAIPAMDPRHEITLTEYQPPAAPGPVSHEIAHVPAVVEGNAANDNIVRAWLERQKRYPRVAVVRKLEGEATLYLRLDPFGNVRAAEVKVSSGHATLDKEVLKMVTRADPFPVMPQEASGDTEYYIPIDFSLEQ